MNMSHFEVVLAQSNHEERDNEAGLSPDELYGLYTNWCLLHNEEPQAPAALWAALKAHRITPARNRLVKKGPPITSLPAHRSSSERNRACFDPDSDRPEALPEQSRQGQEWSICRPLRGHSPRSLRLTIDLSLPQGERIDAALSKFRTQVGLLGPVNPCAGPPHQRATVSDYIVCWPAPGKGSCLCLGGSADSVMICLITPGLRP